MKRYNMFGWFKPRLKIGDLVKFKLDDNHIYIILDKSFSEIKICTKGGIIGWIHKDLFVKVENE